MRRRALPPEMQGSDGAWQEDGGGYGGGSWHGASADGGGYPAAAGRAHGAPGDNRRPRAAAHPRKKPRRPERPRDNFSDTPALPSAERGHGNLYFSFSARGRWVMGGWVAGFLFVATLVGIATGVGVRSSSRAHRKYAHPVMLAVLVSPAVVWVASVLGITWWRWQRSERPQDCSHLPKTRLTPPLAVSPQSEGGLPLLPLIA